MQVQVQKQETMMKVMVAIDESDGSLYALQWVLENLFLHHRTATTPAAEEEPPTVTVVHVQPPFQQPFTAIPVGPGNQLLYLTTLYLTK